MGELMYDSTTPWVIPATAKLILTYIDGGYKTDDYVAQHFPSAQRMTTTTTAVGSDVARIYDCERGDGDANQAAVWAKRKIALGQRPTIYCSRIGQPGYGWQWVKQSLSALGIPLSAVDFGIADYTGTQHLVPGSVFTQYANPAYTGKNYDLSITDGIWPNPPVPNLEGETVTSTQTTQTVNGTTVVQLHVFDDVNGERVHWWQDLEGPGPLGQWHAEKLPPAP